ncbi:TonB family protein [Belliella kenyensis]|uniref:TonB family protein n=1 Tax=Belliella kenyensis TaxID=1472724 RepID=A0ABV8ELN9_9BACT|nr:TonB family protein [Belliella kenyensis]MCH7400221.1 M56 family metallopeptidase [Belliella kenyensis]MDN3604762.1 TonB family protein [Belliella kenyensis]
MAALVDYIWQSIFCLLFFYGIYWVFLRNEKAFVVTRIYILITPILALLFPLVEIPVGFEKPDISIEHSQLFRALSVEQVPEEVVGTFGLPEVTVQSTKLPVLLEIKDYLLIAYLSLVVFLTLNLFWQLMQMRLIQEKGWYQTTYKLREKYFLIPTYGLTPIFSYFNKLFWDDTEKLTFEEKDQILKHELVHIKQKHTWDILYYQILTILFWFNPAIHLMKSALVDVHEYLADENVLKQTENKSTYPKLIAKIAFKGMDLPIGNYFIRSTTLKRILMIKKNSKPNWFKLTMIIPLTIMLMGLISMKTKSAMSILMHGSIERIELIRQQLIDSQDSIDVSIKVKRLANPKHYELIGPREGDKLKVQLGELVYEFSEISSDEEYMKVRSLIKELRKNSQIAKSYGDIPFSTKANVAPRPADATEWQNFLQDKINEALPAKEKALGLGSILRIEFIVDQNGKISNPVIKESFGSGVDEKLIQAISSPKAPKWIPGEVNGKNVPMVHDTSVSLYFSEGMMRNADAHSFFQNKLADTPLIIYNGEEVFDLVEAPPVPHDGYDGWNQFLRANLRYPQEAIEAGEEGTVYLSFIVSREGKLDQFEVIRGVSPSLDSEALRVLAHSPDWTPGTQRGIPVNVKMRLPIKFKGSKDSDNQNGITSIDQVDKMASPAGGFSNWQTYINNNLRYPLQAQQLQIEGTVYLAATVDSNGKITNPQVLRGIGFQCDQEALRLVTSSPDWIPAFKEGKSVDSIIRIPIKFELDKSITSTQAIPTDDFKFHMRSHLKYPTKARENNEMGTVISKLVLNEKGKIIKTSIVQGLSKEINEEVLKALANAPEWKIQKPLKNQEVLFPVSFRIHDGTKYERSNLPNEIKVTAYPSSSKPERNLSF